MKKIILGVLILAAIALIVVGFSIKPASNSNEKSNGNTVAQEASLSDSQNSGDSGAATETVIEQVQTQVSEPQPQTPVVPLIKVTPYSTGDQFSLIVAANDYNGEKVDFYCGDHVISSVKNVNADGTISFYVNKADCPVDSDTYLMIGSHESEHFAVTFVSGNGGGSPNLPPSQDNGANTNTNQPFRSLNDAKGVPEFSFGALIAAVVIGGLGLAYLRKQ